VSTRRLKPQAADTQDVLRPGLLARALRDLHVMEYVTQSDGVTFSRSAIIPSNDVFTVLKAEEIIELPAWDIKLLHNCRTYFVYIAINSCMIEGEEVAYDFPFEPCSDISKHDHA
jgi:hypothetical protein